MLNQLTLIVPARFDMFKNNLIDTHYISQFLNGHEKMIIIKEVEKNYLEKCLSH